MTALPAIDWQLAARVGGQLVRPGPSASRAEIEDAVAALHVAADKAIDLVAAATELPARVRPDVFAVDRASWIAANTQLADAMFALVEPPPALTLRRKVGRRLGGALLGAGLAAVGGRILGQYDPLHSRLLLVAPNIIALERAGDLVSADFRLWATLHEQTHAVQFGAAPWLLNHVVSLVKRVAADESVAWVGTLAPRADPDVSAALSEVMALMTLLEGHADVMMDLAGRDVVPTWARLRAQFDSARAGRHSPILASMGVLSKAEQYGRGAAFCRAVVERAGVAGLNTAFTSPDALPTAAELVTPSDWLERVHG